MKPGIVSSRTHILTRRARLAWPPEFFFGMCCCPTTLTLEKRNANSGFALQWTADHGANLTCVNHDGSGNVVVGGYKASGVNGRLVSSSGSFTANLAFDAATGPEFPIKFIAKSGSYILAGGRPRLTTVYSGELFNTSGSSIGGVIDSGNEWLDSVVDSSGNIYALYSQIRKWNSSGTLQWTKSTTNFGAGYLGLDSSAANLIMCGNSAQEKYSSGGTLAWANATGSIRVAVDSTGAIWTLTGGKLTKLTSGGSVSVSNIGPGGFVHLAVDPSDLVYALQTNGASGSPAKVYCYDSSGSPLWNASCTLTNANAKQIACDGTSLWVCGSRQ